MIVEFVGGPLDGEYHAIRDGETTYPIVFCQSLPAPLRLHTWRGEYRLSPITSYGTMPLMHWHGEQDAASPITPIGG